MLDYVLDYALYLVFGNYLVNTLGEGCQDLAHVFLFGFEVFYEGAIEGEKNQLMSPDYSADQTHVDQFVLIFLAFSAHYVEKFLGECLRTVN